jgi:hypothetical protein
MLHRASEMDYVKDLGDEKWLWDLEHGILGVCIGQAYRKQ